MQLRKRFGAFAQHAWTRGLAVESGILAAGAITYVAVRKLTEGNPARAVDNAQWLFEFERSAGVNIERSFNNLAVHNEWLRNLVNWVYMWGHWPVIVTVAIWLFITHRERYVWLRNAIFASGMIGFAFFAFVPMAPPRLAGMEFVDTITRWSSSYRVLQPPDYANIYAAMPSLHFGWDLLVGVALFTSTSIVILRVFALMMPSLMAFAVISTANHWILDVVVGLLVVTAGAVLAEAVALGNRRRAAIPIGSRQPVRESASSW